MVEITGPQKRKDTFYALCSAAHALNRKFYRYVDSATIDAKATALTDQILSPDATPVIDTDMFAVDEALPVLAENGRTSVVVEGVRPGYKLQTPVENALSDPKYGLTDIRFKDSAMEFTDYRSEPRYASVEKIAFENVTMDGVLARNMPSDTLTELSLERCRMDKATSYNPNLPVYATLCSNALAIAEKNPLRRLFMNEMSITSGEPSKESEPLNWSKLPVTLEYLSLEKTDVMNANFDGLMEALPKLKNLKALDMSSCGLTDEHAEKLAAALQKTQIARINVSGNRFSEGARKRLSALPDKQVEAADYIHWNKTLITRETANDRPMAGYLKDIKTKEDMFAADMIFPAAKGSAFRDVLDALKTRGEYMTPEDYDRKGGDGKPLLEALIKTEQLPVVFDPQYWNDPKKMQALWERVPEKHRSQLGGKDGKVAFVKRKNQVMSNAVKSVLSQRTKRMR